MIQAVICSVIIFRDHTLCFFFLDPNDMRIFTISLGSEQTSKQTVADSLEEVWCLCPHTEKAWFRKQNF